MLMCALFLDKSRCKVGKVPRRGRWAFLEEGKLPGIIEGTQKIARGILKSHGL
jgi:hypothetical protein